MNPNIKRLAMEAGRIEQVGPEVWSDNQVAALVDLVVLECLAQVKKIRDGSESAFPKVLSTVHSACIVVDKQIKNHFGVEE